MTIQEAKKLEPGDLILIEGIVRNNIGKQTPMSKTGKSIAVRYKNEIGEYYDDWIAVCNIREKLEPPRRFYKKGDIVKAKETCSLALYYVAADELAGSSGICLTNGHRFTNVPASELELVCAADKREDEKEEA